MRVLSLLAAPINGRALRTLREGRKSLVEVRRECGAPAQTTLRAHLKELEAIGTVQRPRGAGFPGAVHCELTAAGRELLPVIDALERWLRTAPEGPIAFGTPEAKAAIKALVEGWSSTMLRALAARPLSLTELDGVISGLSYPSLERRLGAMRLADQLEACATDGHGIPYRPTAWLRRGMAPVAAAARWERRHLPEESPPLKRIDTESFFLLTLPLLRLPEETSGTCRLGIEMRSGDERRLVGAMVNLDEGRLTSCNVRLDAHADSWATGSTSAWLTTVIDGDADGLELGGDQQLAQALVDGMHGALFGRRAGVPS